jgi:hypothetical protein
VADFAAATRKSAGQLHSLLTQTSPSFYGIAATMRMSAESLALFADLVYDSMAGTSRSTEERRISMAKKKARKHLERMVGRALLDPKFRERLLADPEKALREEGFELSEEDKVALEKIDRQQAQSAIEALDEVTGQPWS